LALTKRFPFSSLKIRFTSPNIYPFLLKKFPDFSQKIAFSLSKLLALFLPKNFLFAFFSKISLFLN
ncbi:hypothetical protein, partial [Mycoplasmoides pneumoniae]|uniref:hypothetical protein n=1 Tax=Mycoplasmoides pneumoniae TaxID=2104 RepID=UPI001F31BCA4